MCLSINILLLILLYNLPIETNHSLCIIKNLTGKECWGCGLTRAFLSVLHLDFKRAMEYNWRVIIVFPYTVILYVYVWMKYIIIGGKRNARKI
jgi:hypothetical protein